MIKNIIILFCVICTVYVVYNGLTYKVLNSTKEVAKEAVVKASNTTKEVIKNNTNE